MIVTRMTTLEEIRKHELTFRSGNSPDWSIEGNDSPDIPIRRYPAPKCSIAVNGALACGFGENIHKGRNKWNAIADYQVENLHFAKLLCIKFPIECEVYIACHGESPIGISRHEPDHIKLVKVRIDRKTYIWIKNAWNWQIPDLMSPREDLAIRVAILVMILPMDA